MFITACVRPHVHGGGGASAPRARCATADAASATAALDDPAVARVCSTAVKLRIVN